jgi:hypothetical protein
MRRMGEALAKASGEFSNNRLLFSPGLDASLNKFFFSSAPAGTAFGLLQELERYGMVAVTQRAELIDKIRVTAFKDRLTILDEIRKESQKVIHG